MGKKQVSHNTTMRYEGREIMLHVAFLSLRHRYP
jgi:hypothetical protein